MEKNIFLTVPFRPKVAPHHFESVGHQRGFLVAGIDEAGRGPLAGPVVAAAAILKAHFAHPLLKDSKTLTKTQLQEGYTWLLAESWFGVGIASHQLIDRIGIVPATRYAMERAFWHAYASAPVKPATILVDALPLHIGTTLSTPSFAPEEDPLLNPEGKLFYFPYGETFSYSIAAASIIAKVTRDRIMESLSADFPQHHFNSHKGYGTAQHLDALATVGKTIIHRNSFLSSQEIKAHTAENSQLSWITR